MPGGGIPGLNPGGGMPGGGIPGRKPGGGIPGGGMPGGGPEIMRRKYLNDLYIDLTEDAQADICLTYHPSCLAGAFPAEGEAGASWAPP